MLAAGATKEFDARWGDPKLFLSVTLSRHVAARPRARRNRVTPRSTCCVAATARLRRRRVRPSARRDAARLRRACSRAPAAGRRARDRLASRSARCSTPTASAATTSARRPPASRSTRGSRRRLPKHAERVGEGRAQAARRHDAAARRAAAGPGGGRYVRVVARALARSRPRRANPNPGRVALHRLNRAEYANAIEDLLGAAHRRQRAAAEGRRGRRLRQRRQRADGVAVVPRSVHLRGARRHARARSAIRRPRPGSMTYRPARGTDQAVRVDGLPLGTRGGLLVEHLFPADGDYKLNINGLADRRLRARHGVSPHARRDASTASRCFEGRSAAKKTSRPSISSRRPRSPRSTAASRTSRSR